MNEVVTPHETVRITLERGICLGRCPIYSVTVRGDGSASYTGEEWVLVDGHYDFTVPEAAVRGLLEQFREADFWSLDDAYVYDMTDCSEYRVTLTIGSQTKTVLDYVGQNAGMPAAVTALQNEIDRIAADRWVKGTQDTMSSLREVNFDFRSPAAATILAKAAATAPDALFMAMLDAGAPVIGKAPVWARGAITAVENASWAGRPAVVEALIAKGAFAAGSPGLKEAALRCAAASGNPLVVAAILKQRPDVDARDDGGETALIAMSSGRFCDRADVDLAGVARLLLAAGADPNLADDNGNTALFSASDAAVVPILIAAGAKIEVRNEEGCTPLLSATTDEAAVALIEAGADVTVTAKSGWTVEAMATSGEFEKTLRMVQN